MRSSIILYLVVLLAVITISSSAPATLDDIFPGFVKNANINTPDKTGELKKRRIFEENRDGELKQVSLQSLIGGIEDSLFQSALSVSGVAHNKAEVQEVKPAAHVQSKREADNIGALKTGRDTLLQTTEKVPEKAGIPAHILIDRISVQPHSGGIPLIPAFQVQHTKLISATIKEQADRPTQITITKTDIKGTSSAAEQPTIQTQQQQQQSSSTSTVITNTADTTTTTTKTPIIKLKEAEQELKEKVAEIEAEPVILTARV